MAVGGYVLVGACSIAVAALQLLSAAALPRAPARAGGTVARPQVVATLRSGTRTVARSAPLRRLALGITVLVGVCSFDEYVPLLAGAHGASATLVPVLFAVVVAAQIAGTALAGAADRLGTGAIGTVIGAAAVLIAVGALARPLVWFVALAAGYGLLNTAMVIAQARLQHTVPDTCRATVTSVVALSSEAGVLAVFAGYGLTSGSLGVATTTVLVCVPLAAAGLAAPRWLPGSGRELPVDLGGTAAHPVGMQEHEALVGPEPEQGAESDRADVHREHDPTAVGEVQGIHEQGEDEQ
jgi:hypothetical protein